MATTVANPDDIPSDMGQGAVHVDFPKSSARVEKPDLAEPIDHDGRARMCHHGRRHEQRKSGGKAGGPAFNSAALKLSVLPLGWPAG
ncbi:MAG: hypothetical protein ACREUF_06135 [Solimonas sp.]